jgi:hypothetical protein
VKARFAPKGVGRNTEGGLGKIKSRRAKRGPQRHNTDEDRGSRHQQRAIAAKARKTRLLPIPDADQWHNQVEIHQSEEQ